MFGELIESHRRRVRQGSGPVVSMIAHCTLVGLALLATRRGAEATPGGEPREVVIPVPVEAPLTRSQTRMPSQPVRTPVGISYKDVLPVPDLDMADVPPIDLLDTGPTEIGWRSSTTIGTPMPGDAGDSTGTRDGIPFGRAVEKPAIALPGNTAPRYPDLLRNAGVEGSVTIQVVVDTSGRADPARIKVIRSAHPLLDASVVAALPKFRFLAAETGGRKVAMWVEMTFLFELKR
jgi:protein TonB